ncbi:molecular chaperone [Hydrocoleum sp. CS-953]|uniref:Hsp20/alpha crystallin family protein n=1 Tax=Hydrocoleum sp. CS-953 TaxID=1671698 RepID=UPI000B9A42CD|nr:Hsp20/alpha crystallin family protein [Hydrocoleum sp. CS-953]OZH51389.1 molecular chaperone [Hydrocoleum sp. CS-953]
MAIVRFSPWREVDSLQKEMNHLFDTFAPTFNGEEKGISFTPAAEIHENHDSIDLKLEIPGLEAKDLDVQVTAEAVAIKGERRQETQTEEEGMTRSEFRYGAFQRVISLPARVQNNQVKADYKDGILHLHLPKAEAEKNKVVKVSID